MENIVDNLNKNIVKDCNDNINKIEIDEFISLGSQCLAATLIKDLGFRTSAYPFDWVFTNGKTLIDCFENDFKNFLDKSKYYNIGNHCGCGHKDYHEMFFKHKNPCEDIDYVYYERCIERFRNVCKSDKTKLFIMSFINCDIKPHNLLESNEIAYVNEMLSKTTKNYYLLIIIFSFKNKSEINFQIRNKNLFIVHIITLSKCTNGLRYRYHEDNDLIKKYINDTFIWTNNPYNHNIIHTIDKIQDPILF
jgi:hypothetical protein